MFYECERSPVDIGNMALTKLQYFAHGKMDTSRRHTGRMGKKKKAILWSQHCPASY